jgi:hypothetical protein
VSFVDELADAARLRYVHWDHALWQRFLSGPAVLMSQALGNAPGDPVLTQRTFQAYLRLASDGIGHGYLFPAESGAENVFGLAWNTLLPKLLPQVAPERRAGALAACWNLAENLELGPLWLRRLVHRALVELPRLDDLEALIAHVEQQAFAEAGPALDHARQVVWIDLAAEDRRFLPGSLHHLAPRVVCVHDRERTGGAGLDPLTCGVFLGAAPQLLGPMGCTDVVPVAPLEPALAEAASRLDVRFDAVYSAARHEGSALVSLQTSQRVVALLP